MSLTTYQRTIGARTLTCGQESGFLTFMCTWFQWELGIDWRGMNRGRESRSSDGLQNSRISRTIVWNILPHWIFSLVIQPCGVNAKCIRLVTEEINLFSFLFLQGFCWDCLPYWVSLSATGGDSGCYRSDLCLLWRHVCTPLLFSLPRGVFQLHGLVTNLETA